MPNECRTSYAVTSRSAGGGSGAATTSSAGISISRVPSASATLTRSPSAHAVPRLPMTRVSRRASGRRLRPPIASPLRRRRRCGSARCNRLPPSTPRSTTRTRLALTPANSPSVVRTWSITCGACAPSQPPPLPASDHHDGTSLLASASRGMCITNVPRRTSPMVPSRTTPREESLSRGEAHLCAEEVHHTSPFGRVEERARFARVARERLLAQDVLTGRDRDVRERRVRVRRSGNCHGVHVPEFQRVGQRRERVRDVEAPRARFGVLSGSRPTRACTSKPAARSARTCVRHPKPVPTTATPAVIDRASRPDRRARRGGHRDPAVRSARAPRRDRFRARERAG